MIIKNCPQCKSDFWGYQSAQRIYCSKKCYAINMIGEKNQFYGKKHSIQTRQHISKIQTGRKLTKKWKVNIGKSIKGKYILEKSSRWKGGRRIDCHRYILLLRPEHPNHGKDGYVFEHRVIAESIIKRFLKPTEIIHHIDNNPSNNNPNNLYIFKSNSEHIHFHALRRKNPNLTLISNIF